MGFNETYTLLKDLVSLATKAKNQPMINLANELQAKFFDLKENNEQLKEEIKRLKEHIVLIEQADITEQDLIYNTRGFILKKDENPPIAYCTFCWKKEHKLLPLSQYKGWYDYRCANCKSDIVVMTENGGQLGIKGKKNETKV